MLCCVRATIAVTPLDGPNKYHSHYDSAPASIKRIFFTDTNMFFRETQSTSKEVHCPNRGVGVLFIVPVFQKILVEVKGLVFIRINFAALL